MPASSSYTPDLSSCPLAAQASLVALSESLTHPSRHWSHLTHSDKRKYYPDICRPLSLSITCHSASQCGNLKRIIIQSEYNGLSEKERQVRETRRIICLKLAGWPPGLWQWQLVYSRLKEPPLKIRIYEVPGQTFEKALTLPPIYIKTKCSSSEFIILLESVQFQD